ncbi:alpha-mannosidase [Paenibacillus sp. 1001270B_150601_E10]|uniref:alpha-mannosidase n=1 Tax=Paenibacillus sp. 1001270B_150601_E10 TaxID=2787079 RepID=UPI00189F0D36|nr:alpha-mannosidase [Paenibacillus sp. 1001270B_150601_E10]
MERIHRWIQQLSKQAYEERMPLDQWKLSRGTYVGPRNYEMEQLEQVGSPNQIVKGEYGTTYLFETVVKIPSDWDADAVGFRIEAGGEGLLSVNGKPYHGLDRNHSFVMLHVDKIGWEPSLTIELFDPIPEPIDPLNGKQVRNEPIRHISCELVHVNKPLESLLFTATVLRDTARLLPESSLKRTRIMETFKQVIQDASKVKRRLSTDFAWVMELENQLRSCIQENDDPMDTDSRGIMHMVGQSHIDVAWLWPVRETIRKCSRTFSTVMTLMDEYPEFQYAQSQPQLYAYVKEYYPALYERIKERVADGRWELVGGMWVEPDLNIPSGESLVRQLLYGQLFYEKEFGKRSVTEWVPDTFGYCASLPQLLKQAGMKYFMTSKLNWNDTNAFPYDLFHWVGIDGTPILSFLNHGLNEHTVPKDIAEHWASYRQKDRHSEQMLLYGHGDGGGGVTREMLEILDRAELMTSLPKVQYSNAKTFFEGIGEGPADLPSWHGDLYLELHRGTYTTHARNKRWNRKAEVLYREAEIWNSLYEIGMLTGVDGRSHKLRTLPAADAASFSIEQTGLADLKQGWELLLLNQFHDIIPGTAITEVYETSAREYEKIFELGEQALNSGLEQIVKQARIEEVNGLVECHAASSLDVQEGTPYLLFNSLGWEREASVVIEGGEELLDMSAWNEQGERLVCDYCAADGESKSASLTVYVPSIPAFGYTTIWLKSTKDEEAGQAAANALDSKPSLQAAGAVAESLQEWETPFYLIAFNDNGELCRLYDKEAKRELVKSGEALNVFQLFHDTPTYWDAWDIDPKYEQQQAAVPALLNKELILSSEQRDVFRLSWQLHHSMIQQDIIFYKHRKVIDFCTAVDWREDHKLLKVSFPVDLVTTHATYEIPFGTIERPTHRNTSWQQAQYEVCGHRFADVSEGDYGVSLLNDCKYGYDVHGSTLRLSLLRSPRWPDETADQGVHTFTYSLYPHLGSWRQGHVVQKAMELNHSIRVMKGESAAGRPSTASFLSFDSEHVILDTIKPAEDGKGYVLRFYESSGSRGEAVLGQLAGVEHAYLVTIIEDIEEELDFNESGELKLEFLPYEIKSIKLVIA